MSAPLMHCRYFLERDAGQPHLVHISVHIASSPFADQLLPEGHQQLLQHITHMLIGFAVPAASTKPGCLLTVDANLTALTEQDTATQASSIACLASLHATAASWQIRCVCMSALHVASGKQLWQPYACQSWQRLCVSFLWGWRLVGALAWFCSVPLRRAACAAQCLCLSCAAQRLCLWQLAGVCPPLLCVHPAAEAPQAPTCSLATCQGHAAGSKCCPRKLSSSIHCYCRGILDTAAA